MKRGLGDLGVPLLWGAERRKRTANTGIKCLRALITKCACGGACPACRERAHGIAVYEEVLARLALEPARGPDPDGRPT